MKTTASPAFGGASFGLAGQYEQLDGTAYGEVDPNDPANTVIQDIALAPRNDHGMVSYSMDVSILKPVNLAKGNHVLLYDVVNRGNKIVTGFFNVGATAANPAGDGFVEKQGYSIVWSGWQGDLVPLPGQLGISVPVAVYADGKPITGLVRSEFVTTTVPAAPVTTQNLTAGSSSYTPGYPATDLDTTHAVLTRRVHQADPPQAVPAGDFAFADCTSTPFPGVPNPQKLCLRDGFDTNQIYELYYTATNPLVLGLGFAATRDLVTYLRNTADESNPLSGSINVAVMHGTSQSGRWAREYLQLGFNADETGQRVFDGMNPHIASGRGSFNIRFGTPGRLSGTEHTEETVSGSGLADDLRAEHRPVHPPDQRLAGPLPGQQYLSKDRPRHERHGILASGRCVRHHGPAGPNRLTHPRRCAHLPDVERAAWWFLAGGTDTDHHRHLPADR